MTVPRWQNERAAAAFVADQLNYLRSECERLGCPITAFDYPPEPTEPPELVAMWRLIEIENWTPSDDEANTEEKAVAAALRGNIRPLADLIRPMQHPREFNLPDEVNPSVSFLPFAWLIVSQFLSGERSLKTGNMRGLSGRPPLSIAERRASNPVHRAADEARVIIPILKHHYPRRSQGDILDRAAKIAAERNGSRYKTLLRHLARSARDRRRIT
jgi:hypothetical protein